MSVPKFYNKPTEYAKDNENIRIDFNYDTLAHAKANLQDPIWIQQLNSWSDEKDVVDLSLEQAKWLVEQLQYFIKLIEEQ